MSDCILLSISVGLAATLLNLPPAVAVAWYLEKSRLPGRGFVHTLTMLPLVLPPVVVGYLLLALFSPLGAVGKFLERLGAPVAFHWLGAVVAAAVVGFPLFVMMVGQALKAVDSRLEVVSQSLGRSAFSTFFRVTLPLCWPGIVAGAVVSFARGMGEFGATIILAGRISGKTDTIPLRIYAELDAPGGMAKIQGLVIASLVICVAAVAIARHLDQWYRSRLELDR